MQPLRAQDARSSFFRAPRIETRARIEWNPYQTSKQNYPPRIFTFAVRLRGGIFLLPKRAEARDDSAEKNLNASKKTLTAKFSSFTFCIRKEVTSAMAAKKAKKSTTKKSSAKKTTKKKK